MRSEQQYAPAIAQFLSNELTTSLKVIDLTKSDLTRPLTADPSLQGGRGGKKRPDGQLYFVGTRRL